MRILFLGEATSPYTRLWAEHAASAFGHEVHLASLQQPSSAPAGVVLHPLAVAAQGMHIAFPPQSRMKRALARYALSLADLVTSWGAHMTRNMIGLGCHPAKIRTIAYGIDMERFAIDEGRPRPGPARLLSTRALRADYNLEPILRALPHVAKPFPDLIWTAVGEGPEKSRLEALAKENRRLVCERASMRENMAVIDGMFRALLSGGIEAVPPVPAHLVVPP